MSDRNDQGTALRVPPHNTDAEAAVLGVALMSADAAQSITEDLSASDFYAPANGLVFSSIRELVADGETVDIVTLSDALMRAGALDQIGGIERLSEILNATPSIGMAPAYSKIVQANAERRRMILAGSKLVDAGYVGTDPAAALDAVRVDVDKIAVRHADNVGALSTLEWLDPEDVLNGLEPEEPVILARTDGACLFYAGKMHSLQGEPSAGKSWVGIVAALEVVDMGGSVLYIDQEDTGRGIVRRCQEAGATISPEFLQHFRYVQPVGALGADELADLHRVVSTLQPDLVIIDGVAESMTRCGLSEDSSTDVLKWADMLPRPLARSGAAVVMLDHVVKTKDEQGRWARGSGAKLAFLDGAAYNVKVRVPFARHKAGVSEIVVGKDRPGGVGAINETVSRVKFDPHAGGERLMITVDPYTAELSTTDAWRPTMLMEKVSRQLEDSAVPLPAPSLSRLVHASKPAHVKEAITRLLAEGFITRDGKSKALRSVKRFRAAWENGEGAQTPPPPEPIDDPQLFVVPDEPDHIEQERQEAHESLWQDLDDQHNPDPE